jgi:hypothetical protein
MNASRVEFRGRPETLRILLADGSDRWAEAVITNGAPHDGEVPVWHEFAAGADACAQLANVLCRLPDPRPYYDDSVNPMTDLPYGAILLTRAPDTALMKPSRGSVSG